MSHQRFRLETIKVTLIVAFHTPSSSLWRASVRLNFNLFFLFSRWKKSSCIKHQNKTMEKTPTDHNKCSHRGCLCCSRQWAVLPCIYEHWVKGFCMRALHDWTLWYGNTGRQPLSKTRLALDPASTQSLAPTHFSSSWNGFLFSASIVAFAE